jgi:hypothetical protein
MVEGTSELTEGGKFLYPLFASYPHAAEPHAGMTCIRIFSIKEFSWTNIYHTTFAAYLGDMTLGSPKI